MGARPLDGVTVVSLEQAVAAPFATRQLADLGARVIKIERPGTGDFARAYDATVRGLSSHFVWLNRSKQSLTLDLKRPEAADALRRLIARADVFVQNLAPGAAERLGLAAGTLRAAHPRLIVCGLSGYGDSGPYRDRKAYDLLVQAESGVMSITGTPDECVKVSIPVADPGGRHVRLHRGPDGAVRAGAERRRRGHRGLDARSARRMDGLSAALHRVRRVAAAAQRRAPRHDRPVRAVRLRRRGKRC